MASEDPQTNIAKKYKKHEIVDLGGQLFEATF